MTNTKINPFKPALRLFLSVDIVGSTAFKQAPSVSFSDEPSDAPPSEAWFSPIAQFYREIEVIFAREWGVYTSKHAKATKWKDGAAPYFWKGIGDEVVYYKEITHHQEAYCCVHCWQQAVNQYRIDLQRKYPKLNLKSTAWLAGFPVTNAEIIFRKSVSSAEEPVGGLDPVYENAKLLRQYYGAHGGAPSNLLRDFIGPNIDTGFRIAQFSTPRKMVVSVELALMLATAESTRPYEFPYKQLKFYFDGSVPLKGVLGGVPYPIIWLDLFPEDKLETAEDQILGRANVTTKALVAFCEEFIAKHSAHICRPYIKDGDDRDFMRIPERHETRLKRLQDYLQKEDEREKNLKLSEETQNQGGASVDKATHRRFVSNIIADLGPPERDGKVAVSQVKSRAARKKK